MDEHTENEPSQTDAPEADSLSLWQVLSSALAAGFGVQSSRNRNRDFSKGKPGQFVAVGVILTVVFVIAIITLVNFVLGNVAAQP
ncbi:MAG: DUF2970 domain-containing protein [Gammaproteobacteria bacterium]|nr:DUF2970 domain-containing protein [Gammaproteobacteria bacterium]